MEAEDADVAEECPLTGFEDPHTALDILKAGGEPPDERILCAPFLWQPL